MDTAGNDEQGTGSPGGMDDEPAEGAPRRADPVSNPPVWGRQDRLKWRCRKGFFSGMGSEGDILGEDVSFAAILTCFVKKRWDKR